MAVIDIQNLQGRYPIDDIPLGEWALRALELLGRQGAELSVVVVDNDQIRDLNRTYLDRDRPTNVISFPQQEGEGPQGEHLGDVVISMEKALQEAQESGMRLDERMLELLVHGICHLAGYNHEGVSEEMTREMEETEERLLRDILGQ
ncbi:MAG: rRNA maturation RNase YbeY [Desulfomonilia bacterium]|jgi:probable rRNA maturation factor|nr:rRNA maturation RNase YbeY [Deltaproteobacteria bacterium]MDX9761839.1 rRNA maturation RNase YbeY [Desulfomonilia bacterium]